MLNKFIVLILLILSRGLLLTSLDYQKSNIIIALICIVFLFFKSEFFRKNTYTFRFDIVIFISLVIAEIFISNFVYAQGIVACIKAGIYYFAILLYYVITYKDKERNTIRYTKKWCIYLSIVISLILIAQYFIYNKFMITFIGLDLSRAYRMGGVRIGEGSYFISVGIILTLSKILNKNARYTFKEFVFYVTALGLELFYIIFVAKTRSVLMIVGISMLFMVFLCSGGIKMKLQVLALSIISVFVLLNSSVFKDYVSLSETESYSTQIRLEALDFYLDQVKDHRILGTGLIYEKDNHDALSYLLHGEEGRYFKSDIGIVGMYNTFGVCGIAWYTYIILRFWRNLHKKRRERVLSNNLESIGLFVYFIGTTPTLILLSPDLIGYIALIMAFIEDNNSRERVLSEGKVSSK